MRNLDAATAAVNEPFRITGGGGHHPRTPWASTACAKPSLVSRRASC